MPTYEQIADQTHQSDPDLSNLAEHEDGSANSYYSTWTEIITKGLTSLGILKSLFNANTILKADSDDTPAALTVAEQTLVGRITGGVIAALTAAQVRTLLNVEDGADVTDATNVDAAGAVMEADYNANTILAATSDDTPVALTVAEQTLIGRITGGAIAALTALQAAGLLNLSDATESGTTATFASATHAYRVVLCTNAAGCSFTFNSGTAGEWVILMATQTDQQVTAASGTATVTGIPTGKTAVTEGHFAPMLARYRTATIVDVWGQLEAA